VKLIEALDSARAELAPATPAWRLRLAVLARKLRPDELYEWFDRLKLRRKDADRIADAVAVGPRLPALLAETKEPAAVRALVEPHDPDGALFAYALAGEVERSRVERYFADFRTVRLEISGGDLAELGLQESPRVGAILEELLRRKLNGELDGRESEIEAAKELISAP
jgi:hypothetical protein